MDNPRWDGQSLEAACWLEPAAVPVGGRLTGRRPRLGFMQALNCGSDVGSRPVSRPRAGARAIRT
jgi:hypothetical protein